MSPKHGVETGEFGKWLTQHLYSPQYEGYSVYYDHGDRGTGPNVAEVKGFFGDVVANRNRLAGVDVMVVKPNGEIIVLIEIEERVVVPKKLVGNVFTILMCNRFAVKVGSEQRYFSVTPETRLIVAGVVPAEGQRLAKIQETIKPRLRQFQAPDDGTKIENVYLVFDEDLMTVIEELKGRISQLLQQVELDHLKQS